MKDEICEGVSSFERVVTGEAFQLKSRLQIEDYANPSKTFSQKKYTLQAFHQAVANTEKKILSYQKSMNNSFSTEAEQIFQGHLLMLKDKAFIGEIAERIQEKHSVVNAIISITQQYVQIFEGFSNESFKEKIDDIQDVALQVLENLCHTHKELIIKNHIVIAEHLYASDILKLAFFQANGIVLVEGGLTSHNSIIAESCHIPLFITQAKKVLTLPNGSRLLLDCSNHKLYINPTEKTIHSFKKQASHIAKMDMQREDVTYRTNKKASFNKRKSSKEQVGTLADCHTLTKDGKSISLLASINMLAELQGTSHPSAKGVGLYRSEFLFLTRKKLPSEAEQCLAYKKLFEVTIAYTQAQTIVLRTLDVGGDKVLAFHHSANQDEQVKELNPLLGVRGIRFSVIEKKTFHTQINALLKASLEAGLRDKLIILLPMVSSIEEVVWAKQVIAKRQTDNEIPPKIGMMIETPAALEIAFDIKDDVDFFSIGTNDLTQYLLAADRTNINVAHLYNFHHPAVLRTLANFMKRAMLENIEINKISICGNMASSEKYLPFLLGIGFTNFTIKPTKMAIFHKLIGKLTLKECQAHADKVLTHKYIEDIERLLKKPI